MNNRQNHQFRPGCQVNCGMCLLSTFAIASVLVPRGLAILSSIDASCGQYEEYDNSEQEITVCFVGVLMLALDQLHG